MLIVVLGAVYAAWFWLLLRSLCARPHKKNYTCYKMAASLCFVFVALACAGASGAWEKLSAMLPALCAYLFGDLLLGLNNKRHDARLLGAGAFAFWVGHLFLLKALAARQTLLPADFLLPIFGTVAVAGILGKKKPKMPMWFGPGVLLYAFTITLLAAKCVHLALLMPTIENGLLAAGGALFLLSDCIIPYVHLTPKRSLYLHILNLSTYYGGMFLISVSLYFAR